MTFAATLETDVPADPIFLPATPAIWRLTLAYLGFDPWLDIGMDAKTPWLNVSGEVVPLHVPAGLAIGVTRLCELLDVTGPAVWWRDPSGGWALLGLSWTFHFDHYTDGKHPDYRPSARHVPEIDRAVGDADALALALHHLDPELRAAGGSDV
jgi:hypothetical protein